METYNEVNNVDTVEEAVDDRKAPTYQYKRLGLVVEGCCPNCGRSVLPEMTECPDCGQALKWSEEDESEKISFKDYKELSENLKRAEEECRQIKDFVRNSIIRNYKFHVNIIDEILPYSFDDIETMDVNDIREFFKKYYFYNTDEEKTQIEEKYNNLDDNAIRETMKNIKDNSLWLISNDRSLNDIRKQTDEVFTSFYKNYSNDTLRVFKETEISALNKALEYAETDADRNKIKEKIKVLENTENYYFFIQRITEKGEEEIKKIFELYFDPSVHGSKYILERYAKRSPKFGYKSDTFKSFFNIEENFLDEKYSPFNNLFLFIYIKYVAYADPYDKKDRIYVPTITSAIANLVYHKFTTTEEEEMFKAFISTILDKFEPYRDFFIENNESYEKHPARLAREEINTANRRYFLLDSLEKMKATGYNEDMSNEELDSILRERIDALVTTQMEDYDERMKKEVKTNETENNEEEVVETIEEVSDTITEENNSDTESNE